MSSELLLTAAADLERRMDDLTDGQADYALSRECAELAARLRHLARWFDRPPPAMCRCAQQPEGPSANNQQPLTLTPREAAELLNVSERTLARLTAAGDLHPHKRGRLVRYARRELEQYAARPMSQKTPES